MRFVPSPLHGWRGFAGEVGVIVLGVLLALGAQQVAEEVQTRADVRAFRETIDHEIGLNLFIYDFRARQFACDDKHVAELMRWLARARAGDQVPALWPMGPSVLTPYRSAWDNRNAQVFNHMPPKQRQKYAEFYDELSNNWAIMQRDQDSWSRLAPYMEPGPIGLADRRVILPILAQIRGNVSLQKENLPISRKIAEVLGVKEIQPDGLPAEFVNEVAECRSVIATQADLAKLNPPE